MEISELLVAAREAAGLTQAGVAAARHVSRGAQSQLELTGARPGGDTIDSFAKAIDSSVIVKFELANGNVISGSCAGIQRPSLADDLMADADLARRNALAAGWKVQGEKGVSRRYTLGAFAAVQRMVAIIESSNWTLATTLEVLMSMAVAEGIELGFGSDFLQEFHSLTCPFPEDEAQQPVYDVTAESQIAFNAVLNATRRGAHLILGRPSVAEGRAQSLPVRGLSAYVASGCPGASEVAQLMARIGTDADWRLAILQEAGYLYGEPTPFEMLPHTIIEAG